MRAPSVICSRSTSRPPMNQTIRPPRLKTSCITAENVEAETSTSRRERRKESREAVVIALEPGRRLEQDRSESIAERSRAIKEDREGVRRFLQLAHVGDVL